MDTFDDQDALARGPMTPVAVRPAQYARLSHPDDGEHRLALAVLRQAARELRQYRQSRRRTHRRLYREALAWFSSPDRSAPFAFESICDLFGFPADAIRAVMLRRREAGVRRAA
jgi:hypothetical protein